MAEAQMGKVDTCTKEEILPLLLGCRDLYVSNDHDDYKNWILFGLDLCLQRERWKEIKQTARARGRGPLNGVVSQLIEEYFKQKAHAGETASVSELVEALNENDLEFYAAVIRSAFPATPPLPVVPAPSVTSSLPDNAEGISSMKAVSKSAQNQNQQVQQQQPCLNNMSVPPPPLLSQQQRLNHMPFPPPVLPPSAAAAATGNEGEVSGRQDGGTRSGYNHDMTRKPPIMTTGQGQNAGGGGLSPFHRAVKCNLRDEVIKLLGTGRVNVNEIANDKHRSTAIHLAAWKIPNRDHAIKMIKILLEAGASLDILNGLNCSFIDGLFFSGGTFNLLRLTWQQFQELVIILLDTGKQAFLEASHPQFKTKPYSILHRAMKEKILVKPTIQLLHSKGVNLNCLSSTGDNLFYYAIWGGRSIETINLLIDCKVNWRHLNNSNWNILHIAARFCNAVVWERFLKLDSDSKLAFEKAENGKTPREFLNMYHPGNQIALAMLGMVATENKNASQE